MFSVFSSRKKIYIKCDDIKQRGINFIDDALNEIDILEFVKNTNPNTLGLKLNIEINRLWDRHGFVKYVSHNSKPWFVPMVKTLRRYHRFWKRKMSKMRKFNLKQITINNIRYSIADVEYKLNLSRDNFYYNLDLVRNRSNKTISNMLKIGLYSTVKKIYKKTNNNISCFANFEEKFI